MDTILIKDARIINEGTITEGDIYIKDGRIEQIGGGIDKKASLEIKANQNFAMPGIIDDQVHFRDPGLTYKADLFTEPRAAVAGGVTTFMEMPNTKPASLTQELLEEKYFTASKKSIANYSFFMGASNDNLEEVLKTDDKNVCGVKIFMGSSTGNMLVDDRKTLEAIFKNSPMLIATHCEDEATILNNLQGYVDKYGEDIPVEYHPIIRNAEGCYKSSSMAIELAKKHNSRLHILHISTEDELALFRNDIPLEEKRITAEVCVHHLYFNASDYAKFGTQIKCNPAIKEFNHQEALLRGLLDDRLDIIATDHAPHTWSEKQNPYMKAPSGVPLIQHTLNIMMNFYHNGIMSMEKIVEKMCHAPAQCFKVKERGYLREGYWADIVLVEPNKNWKVSKDNTFYKCAWSPFEGHTFKGNVSQTIVSGNLVYDRGQFIEGIFGKRIAFEGVG